LGIRGSNGNFVDLGEITKPTGLMEEQLATNKDRYKLNAADFRRLFLARDEEFTSILSSIFGKEENSFIEKRWRTLCFKNLEISDDIEINISTEGYCYSLEFLNVNIRSLLISGLTLVPTQNTSLFFMDFVNSNVQNLTFIKCNTLGIISWNCSFENIFVIESSWGGLALNEQTSVKKSIRISNSILDELFFFSNNSIDNIIIEDSFVKDLNFDRNTINKIEIERSNTGVFDVKNSTINEISLNYCLTGDFNFTNLNISSFQVKSNCCSYKFNKSIISQFQLSQCYIPEFKLDAASDINGFITNSYINTIDFVNSVIRSDSLLSFSYSRVFSILAESFSMLGTLYFRKLIKVDKIFEWPSLKNIVHIESMGQFKEQIIQQGEQQYGKFKKKYEKECKTLFIDESTVRFHLSSLGKTEFIDCPLGEYRIEFSNSKITDCFVSGGSIPTDNVHIIGATKNSLEWHQQKASFFNQFKKIFEAQGDIYHATQFQAKWAEEQRKELRLRKKQEYADAKKPVWWSKIKIFFNTTSNDRLTLWLNKISNLHGESWARTLGVFFALIIPAIYFSYLLALKVPLDNCGLLWKYFEFLNPAHSMKFIDENTTVKNGAILLDFIGRIVVSYGIYQFIAAFRKHTKKQ